METTPRKPDPALAALVGRLIGSPTLEWRHHGIGLLQAYVVQAGGGGGSEYRIHVWHPELRFVDEDSGMIHDHRFALESQVLLGAIYDTEIELRQIGERARVPASEPWYVMWEVENARRAAESGEAWVRMKWPRVPKTAGSTDGMFTIQTVEHIYATGSRYSYPPRRFHRSETKELTVTLCRKTRQVDGPAHILARVGTTPKHGIGEPMSRGYEASDPRWKHLWKASTMLMQIAREE